MSSTKFHASDALSGFILEKLDNASVKDLQPTEAMSTEKKWINQLDVTSTKKAILYLI